ncbi:hypothetical protein LTR08_005423 [Meristemomyces frigidus]|nr:hypothetical protein LTR08_005423 [Meristemomyces frigidus]
MPSTITDLPITLLPVFTTLANETTGQQGTITATIPAWAVPNNGSGLAYAQACNAEWQAYYTLVQDYSRLDRDLTSTFLTATTNFSATLTTWCNSIPYAVGDLTPVASRSFLTTESSAVLSYTGLAPSCSSYIVSAGQTFYANRVYISLETACATNGCGLVGSRHTSQIITLESADVYSVCGANQAANSATQFNFPDLNSPVPDQAYNCMEGCQLYNSLKIGMLGHGDYVNGIRYQGPCSVVVGNYYAPTLAVPPQIRTLDPAWATCSMDLRGLYDPPTALTSTAAEASPTMSALPGSSVMTTSAPVTSSSASPASTASHSMPASTSVLQPPLHSSDTEVDSTPIKLGVPNPQTTSAVPDPQDDPDPPPPTTDPTTTSEASVQSQTPSSDHAQATEDPSPGSTAVGAALGPTATSSTHADPNTASAGQVSTSVDVGGAIASFAAQLTSEQSGGGPSSATAPSVSVGTVPVSADPADSNNVVIASTTYVPGDIIQIDNTPISVGTGAVVVAGAGNEPAQTLRVASASTAAFVTGGAVEQVSGSTAVFKFAGAAHTAVDDGDSLVLDGTALDQTTLTGAASSLPTQSTGQPATSEDSSSDQSPADASASEAGGLANSVGATTQRVALVTASGQIFTISELPGVSGAVAIDGLTTLHDPASAGVISGVMFSVGSNGIVVGGSHTVQLVTGAGVNSAAGEAIVTLGSQPVTASAVSGQEGVVVIDGTTLAAGGHDATVDGVVVSAAQSGLVVGGMQTVALTSAAGTVDPQAIVTLGGQLYTASEPLSNSKNIVFGGTTLSQGGPAATNNGVEVSAAQGGLLVAGTQTLPFSSATDITELRTAVTLGGHIYTALEPSGSRGDIVLGSATLSPGGAAATINGVDVSAVSGGLVIAGSETVAFISSSLPTATESTDQLGQTGMAPIASSANTTSGAGRTLSDMAKVQVCFAMITLMFLLLKS